MDEIIRIQLHLPTELYAKLEYDGMVNIAREKPGRTWTGTEKRNHAREMALLIIMRHYQQGLK